MTEINDTNQDVVKTYGDYMDHYTPIRNKIASLAKNKIVADFSCGPGWAGRACLDNSAKFVKFSDARIGRLDVDTLPHSNYSLDFVDLNFPNNYKNYLENVDLIIYFGHLYHATNHEEILDYMIDSSCTEFLIDSKMFLGQDKSQPEMLWYPEITDDERNIWHPDNHQTVNVGRPNLAWVLDYLSKKQVEIKDILTIPMHHSGLAPYDYINFTIHFSKL
jgi:hypothetical protein